MRAVNSSRCLEKQRLERLRDLKKIRWCFIQVNRRRIWAGRAILRTWCPTRNKTTWLPPSSIILLRKAGRSSNRLSSRWSSRVKLLRISIEGLYRTYSKLALCLFHQILKLNIWAPLVTKIKATSACMGREALRKYYLLVGQQTLSHPIWTLSTISKKLKTMLEHLWTAKNSATPTRWVVFKQTIIAAKVVVQHMILSDTGLESWVKTISTSRQVGNQPSTTSMVDLNSSCFLRAPSTRLSSQALMKPYSPKPSNHNSSTHHNHWTLQQFASSPTLLSISCNPHPLQPSNR